VRALWRARAQAAGGGLVASAVGASSLRSTLATLAALTFLNPHVYLDTVVLLGALGSAQPAAARAPFALGAISASLTWFVMLGFGARLLSGFFASARAWRILDVALGCTTLVIAVGLALG